MNSQATRQSFIDFFVERGHRHEPSAPLVPHGDATLMFTNAGMVQFKNYFLGVETPREPRAVTSQKCLRVSGKHNDLENVGPSPRHHTFFEMLGNFSFGDYFKAEAIEFAWKLVTEVWGLPQRDLFATVFRDDDEAHDLWAKISGLPAERISRCGEKDNFWSMGDTGPCGPCSEIFIDRQPELPKVSFGEGEASGRYLEIWNLVFMQYERSSSGTLEPLPKPSIDTGAGLERVVAALDSVDSNYGTDLFLPILHATAELASTSYGGLFDGSPEGARDTSMRVVADHLRATSFLLADGVLPSSEGRGYVLRRLLRRGLRHGMRLGLEEPFLGRLVPVLNEVMGSTYPELVKAEASTIATLTREEERFLDTLASGSQRVQEAIEGAKAAGRKALTGDQVFRLYDTFGLPIDTVREIAEEERLGIDEDGFAAALEVQRRRSRSAGVEFEGPGDSLRSALVGSSPETEFVGYDSLRLEAAEVLQLANLEEQATRDRLQSGEEGLVVLDRTVFYAESGGQVGDLGLIYGPEGRARVIDVRKDAGIFLHSVIVEDGTVSVSDRVTLEVDEGRRRSTERHHTATHLLHAALREELGEGVRQAGSLVHPERLRFDFTYDRPLSAAQRERLETTINSWIRRALPVGITTRPYAEAVEDGAMALFGEKYGDVVRTVDVPTISLELCGGCHVRNIGEIGTVVLLAERGVASGVRRVEALAGGLADDYRIARERELSAIEFELGAVSGAALDEVKSLRERLRETERELKKARLQMMSRGSVTEQAQDVIEVGGVRLVLREVPPAEVGELRSLADVLRQRLGSGVVVLGTRDQGKVTLLAAVTNDLEGRVHAGKIAKALGESVGGRGGGRADFAQAGGKDPGGLDRAFEAAKAAVSHQLGVELVGVP